MSKKLIQRLATVALILVIAAGSFMAYGRNSQSAYNVPRILGMEGDAVRAIQLDGPPTKGIEGPFVENHGAPVSLDIDLRDLPQVGPAEKRPMREMGQMPALSVEDA